MLVVIMRVEAVSYTHLDVYKRQREMPTGMNIQYTKPFFQYKKETNMPTWMY